jgi:hypothetical protein
MTRRHGIMILSLFVVAILGLLFWYRREAINRSRRPAYGVTFSTQYAKWLGLDWQKAFIATLDDLRVRKFRIPVYWDDVESQKGHEDWSETDWMLKEAAARKAGVILAIGRKTPRWPECHVPGWAQSLGEDDQRKEVLRFLKDEVDHFKGDIAVKVWQVENEPLFQFGKCPQPDRAFLKTEIALVRSIDPRPVMVTDSGELSTWIRTGSLGDILGISMYRLIWNKYLGELYWPVSPFYYTDRMNLLSPVVKKVIISELQAEPWFTKEPSKTPIAEQLAQMNAARLNDNAEFAATTGASEIYLWGVEWWYWLKTQGHEELWQAARALYL